MRAASRSKSAGHCSSYSTISISYGAAAWPSTQGLSPGGGESKWCRVISSSVGHMPPTLTTAAVAQRDGPRGPVGGDHPDPVVAQQATLEAGTVDGPDEQRHADPCRPAGEPGHGEGVVRRHRVGSRRLEPQPREELSPQAADLLPPGKPAQAGADAQPDQDLEVACRDPVAHRLRRLPVARGHDDPAG